MTLCLVENDRVLRRTCVAVNFPHNNGSLSKDHAKRHRDILSFRLQFGHRKPPTNAVNVTTAFANE